MLTFITNMASHMGVHVGDFQGDIWFICREQMMYGFWVPEMFMMLSGILDFDSFFSALHNVSMLILYSYVN